MIDGYGNVASESFYDGTTENSQTQYTYDDNNRLTKVQKTDTLGIEESFYSYDHNGNLLHQVNSAFRDASGANEKLTLSSYSAEEPDDTIDGAGLISYTYDARNRLTAVNADNGLTVSYVYDALNRRQQKTVNGVSTNFIWNGDLLVREEGGSKYNFSYGIDLISMTDGTEEHYYLSDAHGDITQLTDADGVVIQEHEYDAFGNQKTSEVNVYNPFRYCNEYYDTETEMIYLRNRYYDPGIGRFITEDPVKDGMNWYAYCNNNPVMFVDPSGLKAKGEVFGYRGENYSDVVALQNKLNELGYVGADGKPLSVDGDFGRNTDYAVRNYQRDNGLTVDGLVGDITWTSFGFKNNALVSNHNVYSGTIKGVYYRTTVMPSYLLSDLSPDEYILVAPAQMLVTSEKAAEQIKMKEKELMDSVISSAMMSGGIKVDIKQINQVANQMGLSKTARRAFGDYVESLKQISGKPGNANFTWKELVEIAKEFLGE